MSSGKSGGKGNPGSKRASSKEQKAERARCWENSQKRKKKRVEEAKAAETRNKQLRIQGQLTPWEQARADRHERRASAA